MFKNVASQKIQLFAFDITTGAPKTGDAANITAYVSKDHGAVTVLSDTSASEMDATNAKGVYLFDLTQGETNADELTFTAKSATANISITPRFISTTPPNWTSESIDSNGRVDVIKIAGTTQTAGDVFARLGAPAGASMSADIDNIQTRIPAALVSGRIDASVGAVAADAITAAALAADAGTEIGTAVWATTTRLLSAGTNIVLAKGVGVTGFNDLSAAQVNAEADTAIADAALATAANLATVAGYIDTEIAAILADTDELQTDWANGGRLDNILDARASQSSVDTIDGIVDDILLDTGTDGVVVAAASKTGYRLSSTGVDDIHDEVVDGTNTLRESVRLANAALGGKASGLAGVTAVYRDLADSKDRITATVDADGNRTAVTTDLS